MAEKDENLLKSLQEKDLEQSLYKARKIFLWSDVNDESAKGVVTRLLSLDTDDPTAEIILYINSPGGSVHDGMAIYDAMLAIQAPVSTVCMGMAMSMGSFLLSAGEPGRRFAWPHARIMIHQPSLLMHTITGTAIDLDIRAKETIRLREELNAALRQAHRPIDVEKDYQRHGPRLLHVGRGSQGIRPARRRNYHYGTLAQRVRQKVAPSLRLLLIAPVPNGAGVFIGNSGNRRCCDLPGRGFRWVRRRRGSPRLGGRTHGAAAESAHPLPTP